MSHLPTLIQDLALILAIAGVTTLLFKKLKQPVVLGLYSGRYYWLVPTFPYYHPFPTWKVLRYGPISALSFLLFSLGLEFSFKKLVKIGGTAGVTGIYEIICMVG